MLRVREILLTLLLSLLILPVGSTLAQERGGLNDGYDVTIQEEEDPILD